MNINNVIIRMANVDDIDAMVKLEKMCFPIAEAASKDVIKERFATFPQCFLVAQLNDQIVGFVNGCMSNESLLVDSLYENTSLHDEKGIYQCVFGLDVHPDYRGHKIATLLMEHFISLAKARHKKGVVLTCKKHLLAFYQSLGFQHLGVSNSTHGGSEWNDMLLLF